MSARAFLLCALFTAAGATAAPPLTFSSHARALEVDAGDESLSAVPAGDVLSGDRVRLTWSGGTLSGSYRNHDIRLDAREGAVSGRIAALALRLGVTASADGLALKGTLGHHPIDLVAGPGAVHGELGGCMFALRNARGRYVGMRVCGDNVPTGTRVELVLPAALSTATDGQLAAVLALALTPTELLADLEAPGL